MKNGLYTNVVGTKCWYLNDKFHREDGPAIESYNGDNHWYLNGKLHREDGPAVEFVDGIKSWWFHGIHIDCSSQEEFERIIKLKAFW